MRVKIGMDSKDFCRGSQGMRPGTKGVFGLKGWEMVGENYEIVPKN
jgi:hypothetical protein